MKLSASTRRLFPHAPAEAVVDPACRPFLFERLLEEGESADLEWLTSQVPESELGTWVAERGGRRLSRRSRRFWELVLGRLAPATDPSARDLWPL